MERKGPVSGGAFFLGFFTADSATNRFLNTYPVKRLNLGRGAQIQLEFNLQYCGVCCCRCVYKYGKWGFSSALARMLTARASASCAKGRKRNDPLYWCLSRQIHDLFMSDLRCGGRRE